MVKITSRTAAIFSFDLILAVSSLPMASLLRLGVSGISHQLPALIEMTSAFALVSIAVLLVARLHRVAWRFISINDALLIAAAALAINLIFLAIMFMWTRLDSVPRAIIPINIFVLTALMIGVRLVLRLWHERSVDQKKTDGKVLVAQNILLLGATDAADAFILTNIRDQQKAFRVVAALDDGHRPLGSLIRGVTIMGETRDLESCLVKLAERHIKIDTILIADRDLRGTSLQRIVDIAVNHSIKIKRLADIGQLSSGATQDTLLPIGLEDLLSRSEATLNHEATQTLVGGKRVLVTGAGGSIGSELVRQIVKLKPSHITLVELSEFNLYEIDHYLATDYPDVSRSSLIANVSDEALVTHIFKTERPELVFHTAALKHVPLLEAQPAQAVLTNVLGTRNVSNACIDNLVEMMVMISTDKAANPVSIMGATKRIAESYCQSLDVKAGKNFHTRFVTVRFGNVLGSAGSVVPLFQKQLAAGGPLTVTHRSMTRYFMTIREAVQLVLQAGTLDQGELERGHIVVLDMGEPVNIYKMAEQLIKLAGLRPNSDVDIVVTGLRPGERLSETIFQSDEVLVGTRFKDLQVAHAKVGDHAFVARIVEQLIVAAKQHNDKEALKLLDVAIANFSARRAVINAENSELAGAQQNEI